MIIHRLPLAFRFKMEMYWKRNWEIYKDRFRDGLTYKALGQKYGLTSERTRQIIYKIDRYACWNKTKEHKPVSVVLASETNYPILYTMDICDLLIKAARKARRDGRMVNDPDLR